MSKTSEFCLNISKLCPAVSAFLENWHTCSLTVSQAAHEAPGPGVTPFEYYILSREATNLYKTHNEAQHASQTPHQIGQVESVRDKNWATQFEHTDEPVQCLS